MCYFLALYELFFIIFSYFSYGNPEAFGAFDFPTNPTNANKVRTYGIIVKNCWDIGSPIVFETSANACPKANNRLAKIAPIGFHFPKIIAAKAIYPRPADMLFEKDGSSTAVR